MSQFPFGVMAKGLLHGFATLYGLFVVGFLFIFAMSFVMPEGTARYVIMGIGVTGFLGFCIVGIVLRCKKSDIFSVREDYHFTITTEGSKIPNGEIITEMTAVGSPEKHPQIEEAKEQQGEAQ